MLKQEIVPVFVMGARRTGTTAFQQLLCSSPDTHPFVGEFQILTQLLQAFAWGHGNYDRMVRFFFRDRQHFSTFQATTVRALVSEAIATLAPRRAAIFKNPELSLFAIELAGIFPHARFVAMIRDPRDQVASEFAVVDRQVATGMRKGSRPSAQELAASFVAYYQPLLKLQRKEPERVRFVRYEDLIAEPMATMNHLCNFLGISCDGIDSASAWDFGQVNSQAMRSRPSWSDLYGRELTAERVGRYRQVLTSDDIAAIEAETGELAAQFRYGAGR